MRTRARLIMFPCRRARHIVGYILMGIAVLLVIIRSLSVYIAATTKPRHHHHAALFSADAAAAAAAPRTTWSCFARPREMASASSTASHPWWLPRFERWALTTAAPGASQTVTLHSTASEGLGLRVGRTATGATLFHVPASSIMTSTDAMRSDVVSSCMKDVGPILGQMEALALHVLARCPYSATGDDGDDGDGGGARPTKQRTREQRGVRLGSTKTTTPTGMEPFFLPFPSSFDDFFLFRPSSDVAAIAAYRGSTSLVRFRKRKRVRNQTSRKGIPGIHLYESLVLVHTSTTDMRIIRV